ETLCELVERDPRVVVLDGDLANSTKADKVAERYPDRFLQMGIAEQNMAGVAAGLATVGFVPWLSSFAVFLAKRDLDQVRMTIAQTNLPVKLGAGYSGIQTGYTGKTHQSVEDLAVMRAMPNMTVIAPGDAEECRQAMRVATDLPGPVYFRLTRDAGPVIFDASYRFELGRGALLRDGEDVALISTGVQTARVLEAAEALAHEGIRATVLHLPTVKPLDEEAVVRVAERTRAVVTAEDHSILGGLGGAVAEVLGERRPTPMRRVGWRDMFGESGPNDALLEKYGLTARHVAEAGREVLEAVRGR
ncbi:MAG: transketolase family protein, partial [Chloroflexota bacterium]|nr:transketolase family protein [Chloroflexota bacterium]